MKSVSLALLLALLVAPAHATGKYKYVRVGNPSDVSTQTTGGTVLMGGGDDVDAAFQWMCQRSGNGDFLVISAKGKAEYNPYIRKLCPNQNSVATLIIPSREAANDPHVADIIQHAEALFIEGGDQAKYINFWQGTPVQNAIQALINRSAPIGGTSAGMNVLSQFVYAGACRKTVPSTLAKANPFDHCLAFAENFVSIPALKDRIDDPHFITRDRMGRDLAFLCRVYKNGWSSAPRDIDVDDQTALLVEPNGEVMLVGKSNAYFLSASGAPEVCQPGTPITYQNIAVYRITPLMGRFNVSTWIGTGGTAYTVSANAGVMASTQPGGSLYWHSKSLQTGITRRGIDLEDYIGIRYNRLYMSSTDLKPSDYAALAEFRYQIRRFLHFSEQASRRAGVEPQQHQLMLALRGAGGRNGSRIADLAERLQIQHHSAVELVSRLEEKDLIQRSRGADDRREVYVSLTAHGEQVLRELTLHHREELRSAAPALIAALRRVNGRANQRTTKRTAAKTRTTAEAKR